MNFAQTAVLGAGSWGTALAILWARCGRRITLWGHSADHIHEMQRVRENADYLPGVPLPENVRLTTDLADCVAADLVVFVTPSTALRQIAEQLRHILGDQRPVLLSCTKGLEHGTGARMSQILEELFPGRTVAVLSGPNLAVEVARELPTATVLGCRERRCAEALQQHLGSPRFRVYTSNELTGIELGGALKNVFAIAAGASDGFGLGDNSKAALVTRALAELLRLGTAMGGDARTFYGLSGAGDLIATCFSRHSRNRRFGEQLGRGHTTEQIGASTRMIAEGVPTAKSAYYWARKLDVDTPIIDQVYAVLYQSKPAAQAMQELLGRDQKPERV